MPAIAAVSLGNSSVTCALWAEGRFVFRNRLDTPELWTGGLFAGAGKLSGVSMVAVASVVPEAEPALGAELTRKLGLAPRYLGRDLDTGLELAVEEPERVGADRLAAALAAHRRFGAAVVADFGTAITVDAVTAAGRFLGGSILPGAALSARALSRGTAGVRVPAPEKAVKPPGRSTADAVAAALTHGLAGAVDRLVEDTLAALDGGAVLVATGGGAELLVPLCRSRFEVLPDLVLDGLVLAAVSRPEA